MTAGAAARPAPRQNRGFFALYVLGELRHNTARFNPLSTGVSGHRVATFRWSERHRSRKTLRKARSADVKTILYFATVVAVLSSLGFVTQSTYGQAAGTRVAVIDVPYIFKNYTGFKAEVEKIQKDMNAFRQWVAEENQKIRAETKKLELYKTGSAEYKQTEEEIARMQMTHRLEGAKREREFMEREAKLYFDLYKRIEAAVADFALRNQIGLVLRFSGEDIDPADRKSIMLGVNRQVVYQSRLDITSIILKKYIETSFQANPDPIPVTGRTGPQIPPRQY